MSLKPQNEAGLFPEKAAYGTSGEIISLGEREVSKTVPPPRPQESQIRDGVPAILASANLEAAMTVGRLVSVAGNQPPMVSESGNPGNDPPIAASPLVRPALTRTLVNLS